MTVDNRRGHGWWKPALAAGAIAAVSVVGVAVVGVAVAADERVATYGPIPEDAYGVDGSIDLQRVPDYVVTLGRDGRPVGYVAKADLFAATGPQTVVARDGSIVGHQRPGYGFVPIDADPNTITPIEASAGPVGDN